MWRTEAKLLRTRWRLLASRISDHPLPLTRPTSSEPAQHCSSPTEVEISSWGGSQALRSFAVSSEAESHSRGSCSSCGVVGSCSEHANSRSRGRSSSVQGPQAPVGAQAAIRKQPSFKISDSLLDKQYKDLQRRLHPDRFSNRPLAEQQLSEDASALVNEAFSTLKQPLRRAEYMLQQRGIESTEDTIDDPELLVGIMEAREAVEAAESAEELQKFGTTFQRQADNCIQGLLVAFQRDDMEGAKQLTTLLRYVTRVQTAILEKTN